MGHPPFDPTPQIRAYGQCVARNAQSIERNACEAEFKGLSQCFRRTVRISIYRVDPSTPQ